MTPRDEPPMRAAWRLARALGCNLIPTTIDRVPLVEGWPAWNFPGAARLDAATLARWRDAELDDLRRGREVKAWALLPGSGRVVVLGADSAEWTERLMERQPTPLVVRSPTPGRAHLYYRWPDGADVSSRVNVAGPDSYDIKARGATCHLPGSLHRSRAGRYVCSLPPEEQVPGLRDRLPVLDLALVEEDAREHAQARRPSMVDERIEDAWDEDGSGARRWAAYLRATPPATQGGRQARLIALAMRAGDFGVAEPVARPGLLAWAATCTPPLDPVEVEDALRRAYLARRSPIGTELVAPAVVVDL